MPKLLFRSILLASSFIFFQSKFAALEPTHKSDVYAVTINNPFSQKRELIDLKNQLIDESNLPKLKTGIYYINPKKGEFINLNANEAFKAASLIKLPIAVALLQAVDKGLIDLKSIMKITKDDLTGGSGFYQWQPIGTKYSIENTARVMITHSDNTATNMIIRILGGKNKINFDFKTYGLKNTKINNLLGDFEGTNTTSPYDLAFLLGRIDRGEILTPKSKEILYNWLKKTRVRTLFPQALGPNYKIYHKTGDIKAMVGDAGIIENKDGSHTILAIQVERPTNDLRANELIRKLTKTIYTNNP